MKHLKLLPLFIAAVFYLPHAHAAVAHAARVAHAAPASGGHLAFTLALLVGCGVAALVPRPVRNEVFHKHP